MKAPEAQGHSFDTASIPKKLLLDNESIARCIHPHNDDAVMHSTTGILLYNIIYTVPEHNVCILVQNLKNASLVLLDKPIGYQKLGLMMVLGEKSSIS